MSKSHPNQTERQMMVMVGNKQPPATSEVGEPTKQVRVIEASELDLTPVAEGYGTIQPARVWSGVAQVSAELTELKVEENNVKASLSIEERSLKIAQRELQRITKLTKQGTASQSDLDTAERTLLISRNAVQNVKNNLALFLVPAVYCILDDFDLLGRLQDESDEELEALDQH
jgi:hypothetical protein